ncbi:MAG TPA: C45 family peptidase [Tepidisphaeraceae bacterium]|jgi:predicted choloylglycine hydrolase|nr:C45 family peptidase [Tepidisphaeraceae bacterium]
MRKSIHASFIALLVLIALVQATLAAGPTTVPVIQLHGDGAQIGEQYAEALGSQVKTLQGYLDRYLQNDTQRTAALAAAMFFKTMLPQPYRDEVASLAKNIPLDEKRLMLAQCFLDLTPMTACSTITLPADASPDGVARFGRNLDFPSLNIADKSTIVLVYHPTGKNAFATITWPGLIGVLSGMNEHGLALANMEVSRGTRLPSAMPYTLLYRKILEECKTVDDAVALLQKTPRQTANNLMLMDASGQRAVVEITPTSVTVRQGATGSALISTNHQRAQDQDTAGRCDRYDYLHDTAKTEFGKIDVKHIESMLDHVSQRNMTLQSMIFEPSNRVVYLARGKNATKQSYERIDLSQFFKNN